MRRNDINKTARVANRHTDSRYSYLSFAVSLSQIPMGEIGTAECAERFNQLVYVFSFPFVLALVLVFVCAFVFVLLFVLFLYFYIYLCMRVCICVFVHAYVHCTHLQLT